MTVFIFYFLRIAAITQSRRANCMNELTNALQLDFEIKDATSIRYPTINFCDAESLATWLEARKIVALIGARFAKRIHCLTLCFVILTIALLSMCIAYLAGYFPEGSYMEANVVQLFFYTAGFGMLTFKTMLVVASMNVQTNKQIKLLIHLRDQIKRIVFEPSIMEMNPNTM